MRSLTTCTSASRFNWSAFQMNVMIATSDAVFNSDVCEVAMESETVDGPLHIYHVEAGPLANCSGTGAASFTSHFS